MRKKDERDRKEVSRGNIIWRMACGKEKEQPTVVYRDTLVHHEKPEVFGTMYASVHIQNAPGFSYWVVALCRMLNARDISMVQRTIVKERLFMIP